MTKEDAKKAIENHSIIQFIEDHDIWGIPVCMDDDETGVYFKKNGCGYGSSFVQLEKIELGE